MEKQPIGIFDSGLGGLTVAAAVKSLLPAENIIYFGDTAHLPYGDKSANALRYYSKAIADFLLEKNSKVVLIACNTASANAYGEVKKHLAGKAGVLDVINPVVEYVAERPEIKRLGVIGTKATIRSGTYPRKILEKSPETEVVSLPTPLFVPMIEEGFIYDDISNAIIRAYLSNEKLKSLDALILGCTHYPIIKNQIRKFFDFSLEVIDSALIVAKALKKYLTENNLLNQELSPAYEFYVSDYTKTFEKIAQMFFDKKIALQQNNLWHGKECE